MTAACGRDLGPCCPSTHGTLPTVARGFRDHPELHVPVSQCTLRTPMRLTVYFFLFSREGKSLLFSPVFLWGRCLVSHV